MNQIIRLQTTGAERFTPVHSCFLQRRALNGTENPVNQRIVHNYLRSPGEPLDTQTHVAPHFGHDFGRLKIHAEPKEPESPGPTELKSESGSGTHPYTAGVLMASGSVEGCKVKEGNYGSAKLMKFRLFDFNGNPVSENLTVGEKFTTIEDNYKVSSRLVPNSYNCEKGFFDDCYRFYQPEPLPDDFRLVVEQNHLLGSEVISKNQITYTPNNILVRVFPRRHGKRDFEASPKMY